jgi:hypothetical protein
MFLRNVGWLSTDYMALYPQKVVLFIVTAVRTSNLTSMIILSGVKTLMTYDHYTLITCKNGDDKHDHDLLIYNLFNRFLWISYVRKRPMLSGEFEKLKKAIIVGNFKLISHNSP